MLILRPDLSDEEREEIFAKITKRIEELEGKVSAARVWAKERNFYYFLKGRGAEKKKYYKGCYWLAVFSLHKDSLGELKETVRLEERILRSMIVNREGYHAGQLTKDQMHTASKRAPFTRQNHKGEVEPAEHTASAPEPEVKERPRRRSKRPQDR
jgi:ribosomal protein S6